ncbi:MAG: HlyD family secretion protein [bacterium]
MAEEDIPQNNLSKKKIAFGIFAVIVIVGLLTGFFYIRYTRTHISTDDAFVEGNVHTVAPKISGTVKAVHVEDNQFVKEGDVLVEVDPADYVVKVNETLSAYHAERGKIAEIDARIEAAKRQLAENMAKVASQKAFLELQKANLEQAELDMKRAETLVKKEVISRERYDRTNTGLKVAIEQVNSAAESFKSSELAVETQRALVNQAQAARTTQIAVAKQKEAVFETARLNYSYTKLSAPADGDVTKKSVEVGNQIQEGQPLMAIVPLDDVYIIANYKETQLAGVKPGQKVKVKVDTYPGKVFKGEIDSIMAGTGAVFSLFPPENATGNYVKVVQRIPVKIILDRDTDPDHVLRIGMSVVPTILIE